MTLSCHSKGWQLFYSLQIHELITKNIGTPMFIIQRDTDIKANTNFLLIFLHF